MVPKRKMVLLILSKTMVLPSYIHVQQHPRLVDWPSPRVALEALA